MSADTLKSYGMRLIGTIAVVGDRFVISISDVEFVEESRVIYAFLVDDEIVRIGSSKAKLKRRLAEWQRGVSAAFQGRRSSTSASEALEWRKVLSEHVGEIYARRGTEVATPIGNISAYLSEELALIERHKPRFCRR